MKRKFINFINKLKEPIHKPDLRRFLLEGFLGAIVFGSMMGAINFFLRNSAFSLISLFTFLIYYVFMVNRLYRSFSFYHIIYSILAVFFILLGDYFMGVTYNVLYWFIVSEGLIIWQLFNPIIHFQFLFSWTLNPLDIFLNLLNILIYAYIIVMTYRRMKR